MIREILKSLVLLTANFAFADSPKISGEKFTMSAPVVWAATNPLPRGIMVYQVVPRQFSPEAMSNILKIASFQPVTMKLSADKKTMRWESADNRGGLNRTLEIIPSCGYVEYINQEVVRRSTNASIGVPSFAEVEALAMKYLQWVGGDTNQIASKPRPRIDRTRSVYDKSGKPWLLDDVSMRGIMLSRQIDGVRFASAGGRGGFAIDFGTNAVAEQFHLVWRNLQPYKKYRTANQREIITFMKDGLARFPLQEADLSKLPQARKFIVNRITPLYLGEIGDIRQDFMYPFASLEMTAELDDTNRISFSVHCPILSKDIMP